MTLTVEDFKLFKDKLLNEYSEELLDILERICVEDIREYIKHEHVNLANGNYNALYMDIFPILDEIADKLKNNKERVDICLSCEIKAVLKYLFKDIMFTKIKTIKGINGSTN